MKPNNCPHLGEPTLDAVEQIGCQGCKGLTATGVWACDLHGRCAPLARVATLSDGAVTACEFCSDRPPKLRRQPAALLIAGEARPRSAF